MAEIAAKVGVSREQAAAVVQRAALGDKLAKDEINNVLVPLVRGVIAHIQRDILLKDKRGKPILGKDGNLQIRPGADLSEYRQWVAIFADLFKCQMPYELPKLGAFQLGLLPGSEMFLARLARLLGVAAIGAPPAAALPAPDDVKTIDDGEAAMRVYLRVVKGQAA